MRVVCTVACAYARHEISHTGAYMVVMLCVGMMRLWMRYTRVHVYAMYVCRVCMLCIGGGDVAGASSCLVWAWWGLAVLCGRGCWGLRLGGRATYVECEWLCSAYTMHACLQQCVCTSHHMREDMRMHGSLFICT